MVFEFHGRKKERKKGRKEGSFKCYSNRNLTFAQLKSKSPSLLNLHMFCKLEFKAVRATWQSDDAKLGITFCK